MIERILRKQVEYVNYIKPKGLPRYSSKHFEGACLDGGASRSVIERRQAKAYCKSAHRKFRLSPSNTLFMFGIGGQDSVGTVAICILIPEGKYLPLRVDAVDADIPFLLGLDAMDREQMVSDNVYNILDNRRDK